MGKIIEEVEKITSDKKEKQKLYRVVCQLIGKLKPKEKEFLFKLGLLPFSKWTLKDVEMLLVFYYAHYIPIFGCGGLDISNRADELREEWDIRHKEALEMLNQSRNNWM